MQMNRRNALAAFAAAAVPGAWAQDRYPSRPIRIIVTNAAGGASDMIARMIGTGLTAALGQTVAVEPMPAANGMCSKGIVTVTIEAGKVDRCRHPSPFTTAIVFQTPSSVARCAGISDFS